MTRAQHLEHALLMALAQHESALNAAVGVSCLHIDVKFDRSTGLATKAVLRLEMENFLRSASKQFTFDQKSTILPSSVP